MTALTWDQVGERLFETGVDRGVLYLPDAGGDYVEGFPWNGLTTVTESPSGAEGNAQYADNIKYLNLISAEEFGGTIEAFTYPEEFSECDGTAVPSPGVSVGQQGRKVFGMAYRTKLGNDISGTDHGYKLHLVYGAQVQPSEKAYATINDSPEAIAFSWEFSTTPAPVADPLKPTSLLVVDSTKVSPSVLQDLLDMLYGDEDSDARLPGPDEVIELFQGVAPTEVRTTGANAPSYNQATHVLTLPNVTGIVWSVNGDEVPAGAQPALGVGETANVTAEAADGYVLTGDEDWTYDY